MQRINTLRSFFQFTKLYLFPLFCFTKHHCNALTKSFRAWTCKLLGIFPMATFLALLCFSLLFLSFWYKSRFFLFVHILILLTSRLILQLIVSRSIRPLLFFWPMTFPYTQSLGISPTLKRWIFFSNAKECGIKHFKKEVKCDMTNYF